MVYRQTDVGEEEFVYDNANRVIAYKDQRDFGTETNTTAYAYDGFNRVKSATDRMGNQQQVVYKSLSKEYSFVPNGTSEAENHYYEYYDMFGNLTQTKVFPNGINSSAITNKYSYDLAGNLLQHTDGNGKKTSYVYDSLNNPVQVTRADGSVIKTDYTKWNTALRTKQYDSDNEYSTENTYDDRGLVTSIAQKGLDIQTRPWYNEYGLNSELVKVTDPNGTVKTYGYDGQGHVTSVTSGCKTDSMRYNHFGQVEYLSRKENGITRAIDYTYDNLRRLTSKAIGYDTTTYSYNTIGSLTSVTSPNYLTRTYERDALERVTKVSVEDKDFEYEYYADGMIKTLTYPSADIVTTYTYDNANRLKTLETKKGDTVLKTYSYSYDNANNITSIRGSDNISYWYDSLYRLTTYIKDGVWTYYTYDDRDNLISETQGQYSRQYEYDGNNRLKALIIDGGALEHSYDLNGNLIKRAHYEYGYDEDNRMIYSTVGDYSTTYEIGPDGLRTSKTTEGETTAYSTDENGNVLWDDGSEIIHGHKPLAMQRWDGSFYYYIYNGHGDVVMVVDEDGNTMNQYEYDPWGSMIQWDETIPNHIRYAGEYCDDETGFIYLRNRYYDPQTRRFTSEDPARAGLNWYAYCGNNPVNFVDPNGLRAEGEVIYIGTGSYEDVCMIQASLNLLEYRDADGNYLDVDGDFGTRTAYAVRAFQSNEGLTVDGKVGDKTWNVLFSKVSHSKGFTDLRDIPNDEISRRARDKSLPKNERRKYQTEEKYRKQRNKQKRNSQYEVVAPPTYGLVPNNNDGYFINYDSSAQFWSDVASAAIVVVGVVAGVYYFVLTGDPGIVYQYVPF